MSLNKHDASQRAHYGRQYAETGAITSIGAEQDLWEWCKWYPLTIVERFVATLSGQTCLVTCCGAGRELPLLAKHGLRVTATDLTVEHLIPLKQQGLVRDVEVQNAERLTYDAETFDYGFVNAGLHHLAHPHAGLCELLRCARRGVIFLEAQDSILHSIMRLLGRNSTDFESAGNYVYRWKKRELEKICLSAHVYAYSVKTAFVPMFVRMRQINGSRMAAAKWMIQSGNAVLGSVGNVFVGIIFKMPPTAEQIRVLKNSFSTYRELRYPVLDEGANATDG